MRRTCRYRNNCTYRSAIVLASILMLGWAIPSLANGDTLAVARLSEKELLGILRTYHPVVKQADYYVGQADARLTASRGLFDPVFNTQSKEKRFGGELYYDYFHSELVIPTWYGVEIYAGMEQLGEAVLIPKTALAKAATWASVSPCCAIWPWISEERC